MLAQPESVNLWHEISNPIQLPMGTYTLCFKSAMSRAAYVQSSLGQLSPPGFMYRRQFIYGRAFD